APNGADPATISPITVSLRHSCFICSYYSWTTPKLHENLLYQNQKPGGGLIYPGTKWCGPGNLATSYDDLGQHRLEDACCREHDHCPITIEPKECMPGICNRSPFTRSHCDCDAKFRRCLQNLNTEVANTLGALFFNVIQVACFKERRPCSQWQRVGYEESVSNQLCSQFHFRPSEKYVPLMPLNIN
ncbi:acidic phospholipase A2 PA4-like, partial [Hylaeus anthracinus]|uniref:acidic phospholipase A2 PA4-like n=2 Tax=Hylaeus anthracinus TaxID=313031 RepID=UPI0023B8B6A0